MGLIVELKTPEHFFHVALYTYTEYMLNYTLDTKPPYPSIYFACNLDRMNRYIPPDPCVPISCL